MENVVCHGAVRLSYLLNEAINFKRNNVCEIPLYMTMTLPRAGIALGALLFWGIEM